MDGRYVTGGKNVLWATPPNQKRYNDDTLANLMKQVEKETDEKKIDFLNAGIYNSVVVKDAERYIQFPRMSQAVVYALTQQIGTRNTYLTPDNIFTDERHLQSWSDNLLGPLMTWIKGTGDVASILVCSYVFF